MKNLQIFTSIDPLFSYKTKLIQDNPNFELRHLDTNRLVQIGFGVNGEDNYTEELITDGILYTSMLQDDKPSVIWDEELIKLSNGTAISFEIVNSTYTIFITNKNGEKRYSICVSEDTRELYEKAIKVIKNNEKQSFASIEDNGILSIAGAKGFEKINLK